MAGRDLQSYDFGQSQPMVIDQNSVWFDHVNSRARPRTSTVAATTPKAKGNSLLKTLLSIGGGAIGGVIGTAIAPGVGTAIGAGLGSGLGTAAGRAAGQESVLGDGGLGEIALDTALGGAFGGAGKAAKAARAGGAAMKIGSKEIGKKVAGEAIQGAAVSVGKEGAQNFAGRLGKSSVISRGASTIPTATAQDEVLKLSQAYPQYFKGSGKAKFNNVDRFISDKVDEVDSLLGPVKQTVPTANLQREFRGYSQTLSGTPEGRQFDNLTKTIFAPLQGKQELTALEVNNMRRQINKKFPNMFSKNAKGGQLTGAETAASEVRDMLGKTIDDLGGDAVRPINREIAIANQARPEFKRLSEQVSTARIPFVQSPVPGAEQAKQFVTDRVARIGNSPASPLTLQGVLGRQAGRELITGGFSGASPVDETMMNGGELVDPMADPTMQEDAPAIGYAVGQDGTIEPLTADASMGGMGDMGGDPTAGIRQQLQQAMLDDLQLTGGKNVSALKTVLGTLEPEKESVSSKNAAKKLSQALGTVDTLQQQFESAGGGQSYGGYGASLLGALKMNPQAGAYNDMRGGFLSQVSKALGESGVLTDQDIARVRNLVPDLADNPEQAAIKWQALRQVLSGSMGTPSAVGSDTRFANQEVY